MAKCTYCNQNATLTREHIIPKSIINLIEKDKQEPGQQFIAKSGGKYIDGESTIKDVCARCNNVVLGRLDAYASSEFAPQCIEFLEANQTRKINYDYNLLARWLLKIAYNSSRAYQTDTELLRPYRGYIQGNNRTPSRLSLFALGIKPHTLNTEQQIRFFEKYGYQEKTLYPDMFRISQILIPSQYASTCVTRGFFIRSVLILLLLGPKKMPEHHFKSLIHDFKLVYPESARLNPLGKSVVVRTGHRDAWDVLEFHTSMFSHLYGDDN